MTLLAKVRMAVGIVLTAGLPGGEQAVLAAQAAESANPVAQVSETVKTGTQDWPQWRGPTRDGVAPAQKWSWKWSKDGPKVLWRAQIGKGYASPIVCNGKLLTFSRYASKWPPEGDFLECFDGITGTPLWRTKVGAGLKEQVSCTPCTDGKAVFAVTSVGDVTSVDLETGKLLWTVNVASEYKTTLGGFHGIANSPLLVGDALILAQGVGLDKNTGKLLWQNKDAMTTGHASPVVCRVGDEAGVLIAFTQLLIRLDPVTGKTLWQLPTGRRGPTYMDPIFVGDQLVTIGGGGGQRFRFSRSAITEDNKDVFNGGYGYFGAGDCANPVQWAGYLYAPHHADADRSGMFADNPDGCRSSIVCYDLKTLKKMWQQTGIVCSPIVCDGKLIVQGGYGEVRVIEASPNGFKELANARVFPVWTKADRGLLGQATFNTPAFSGGRLYLRDFHGMLACLDLTEDAKVPMTADELAKQRLVGQSYTIIGRLGPKTADMPGYVLGLLTEDPIGGAPANVYRVCVKKCNDNPKNVEQMQPLVDKGARVAATGTLAFDQQLCTFTMEEKVDGIQKTSGGQPAQ